jgi:hypothetical protein
VRLSNANKLRHTVYAECCVENYEEKYSKCIRFCQGIHDLPYKEHDVTATRQHNVNSLCENNNQTHKHGSGRPQLTRTVLLPLQMSCINAKKRKGYQSSRRRALQLTIIINNDRGGALATLLRVAKAEALIAAKSGAIGSCVHCQHVKIATHIRSRQ